jgi:hypothetical protein
VHLIGKWTSLVIAGALLVPAAAQAANEGAPWSAPTYISPENEPAEGPSLGMLADGSLVATWSQDTADGWFPELASQPFAGPWSQPDPISSTAMSAPLSAIGGVRTAFAGDGRFVSAWLVPSAHQGSDVDGAVGSVKPGDPPSASPYPFAANTASNGGFLYGATTPQVVMSSDGSGTVEYTAASNTPSGGTYVGLTPINGGSPGDSVGVGDANYEFYPGPLSQTDFTGFNPSLGVAPLNSDWDASVSDDEALVSAITIGGHAQVYETAEPSGWNGVTPVNPSGLSGETASVAVLADGQTLVAENDGALNIWEPGDTTPIVADNEDTIGYPSIATYADGSATVAFLAYDNGDNTDTVKEVTIAPDGTISEPITLSASGLPSPANVSTAYGPDGTTYVVWVDASSTATGGIYASVRLPGGQFPTVPDTVIAGATVRAADPKVVVDATGFATILAEVFETGGGFRIAAFTHANPILPRLLTAPAITPTGTPQVGSVLTCSKGTWAGLPTVFTYEWLRGGSPIGGATKSTYTVAAADAGKQLSCRVTATNRSGSAIGTSKTVTPSSTPATVTVFKVTDKNGVVTVQLSCPSTAASCASETVSLTVVEELTGGKVTGVIARSGKKKKSKRSVVIATVKVTLPPGQRKTVTLTLNGAGKALLKKRHHLPAALTFRLGGRTVKTKKLTLVYSKPKAKHKHK